MVSLEMSIQRTSTSSTPSTPQWKYDVFLSFRGYDTRRGFTRNLYTALEHEGIRTFMDDPKLRKGEVISPALLAAIEESRIAIIVLSKNYASSTWCLDELVRILECMKARETVLPIFYDVEPSDIRKQTGSFGEAFANHEERFRDDKLKLLSWRSALNEVANFSGWNSKEWYEAELISDVVKDIQKRMPHTSFGHADNLVGIDKILQPVHLLLGVGEDDVRFMGIWGMGGIGKTTMVRAVYEEISPQFEFSFLLTNVRDSVEKGGLLNLQKQLLSGMMGTKQANRIFDLQRGAAALQTWLRGKKVLLILDDVNHSRHLKYLAGNEEWFGLGSRVLITTRDEHLLIEHGVERRLKAEVLKEDDSLQLFSLKAFKRGFPKEDFLDLSESVIKYAKGLPLALEVLGSSLYGRNRSAWDSKLSQLGRVPNSDIFDVLKISYDDLDPNEKKIFLDIACFFNGEDKGRVTHILNSCDFSAKFGIDVLMERSLLSDSYGRLWMHDLLQEMGQNIVLLESPNELGRRSRLWLFEDVKYVLTKNTGTEAIEGIFVDSTESGAEMDVTPKSFLMMHKLRYLKIKNTNLPKGLDYLPDSLRILDWTGYPSKSLPSHFNPHKLVELSLCHSHIKHVRIGTKPLVNLRTFNLSHSPNLVNVPNFKDMPNVELLFLEGCISLHEVEPGIELLKGLTVLSLKDCKNLVGLPSSISGLKSLKVLNLSGCSKVNKLPKETCQLKNLEKLYLSGTGIKELPVSIDMLERLIVLNLNDCKNLVCLPRSVGDLKSLKDLNLSGCSKLDKLPDELGHVAGLEKLHVSGCSIREVPSSIGLLKNLKELFVAGCKAQPSKSWNMMFINPLQLLGKRSHIPVGLSLPSLSGLHSLTYLNLDDCNLSEEAMPNDFGCLASLRVLNLGNNQCITLPESIGQLSRLEFLHLESCQKLRMLPGFGSDVWVNAINCTSLDALATQIGQPDSVVGGRLSNCSNMVENENSKSLALSSLKRHLESKTHLDNTLSFVAPGNEIPEWYNVQSEGSLITLDLHPGWFTSKFLGFAMCVVFRCLKPLPVTWGIDCSMTANGRVLSTAESHTFGGEWGQPVGDHIWFSSVSHDGFSKELQDIYCQLKFSFDGKVRWYNFEPAGVFVQVKKCGLRVVYEDDVKQLETLLTHSNTKRGFQHDDNDDDAASSSASQAHPKRIKLLCIDDA